MSLGVSLSKSVFVVAAKRTPFGTFGGSLKVRHSRRLTTYTYLIKNRFRFEVIKYVLYMSRREVRNLTSMTLLSRE